MKEAIDRVCKHFEAKQVKLGLLKWSLDISSSAMLQIENVESIYFPNVDGEVAKKPTLEFFKYICGFSDFTFSSVMYAPLQGFIRECVPNSRKKKFEDIAQRLKEEFKELLKDNGVFIYPSFPTVAHHHYEIFRKLVEPSYLMVFNTLGLPVTNCMIGLNKNGMPMGLQVGH
jgi:fatty acid amide hydrolase 2